VAVLGACAQDPVDGFDCAFQAARAGLYLSYVLALAGRPAEARNCLDPATHWARQAAADRPDSGQAHALLAEVYGRRVLLGGPMTALRYGPLNGAETAKALSLAPGDPAVLEAQGLRCLYAPALFGGDAAKAQACFERALAQKDSELTRYFLALALRERGMPERARQELLRAHALSPHNGLVNAALAGGPAG
jgi:tetratricopeptide (TPR) repeat protein